MDERTDNPRAEAPRSALPRSQAFSLRVWKPRKALVKVLAGDGKGEPKAEFMDHERNCHSNVGGLPFFWWMRRPSSDALPGHSAQEYNRKAEQSKPSRAWPGVNRVNGVNFGRNAGRVQKL